MCFFRSTSPSAYCWSVKFRGFLCPQASSVGLSGKRYLNIVPCSIFNWKQNVGVFVNCYTFVNYSYSGEFVWRGWVTTSNYWWIPRGLIPQIVQIFAEASFFYQETTIQGLIILASDLWSVVAHNTRWCKGKTFVRICKNTHTGGGRTRLETWNERRVAVGDGVFLLLLVTKNKHYYSNKAMPPVDKTASFYFAAKWSSFLALANFIYRNKIQHTKWRFNFVSQS